MNKLNEAIQKIEKLECPTGELELHVSGILSDYGLTEYNVKSLKRDEKFDTEEAQAFCADTKNGKLIVMASSGMDDYVAKVVNVYMK